MLTLKRAGVNLAALLGGVAVSGFAFGTQAQDSGALASDGEEYIITSSGRLPGEQTNPSFALSGNGGGYLVWQDNVSDLDGLGISAQRLDNEFQPVGGEFVVNEVIGADQESPHAAVFPGGETIFVWQSGIRGQQKICYRILNSEGIFNSEQNLAQDNYFQKDARVAVLTDGTAIVSWSAIDVSGKPMGVYLQKISKTGEKLNDPVGVAVGVGNRSSSVSALPEGGFAVAWLTESLSVETNDEGYTSAANISTGIKVQLFSNDLSLNGTVQTVSPYGSIVANPVIAAGPYGIGAAWSVLKLEDAGQTWDIGGAVLDSAGQVVKSLTRINSYLEGDQFCPQIAVVDENYFAVWTSLRQDGSFEGVFGRLFNASGFSSDEVQVNTTTLLRQITPAVAAQGNHFVTAWSSYLTGDASFDLQAQRFLCDSEGVVLTQPEAPTAYALTEYEVFVSWSPVSGRAVKQYDLFIDDMPAIALTNNYYELADADMGSTHTFKYRYVLETGVISPISEAVSVTTWGQDKNRDGLPDDWQEHYFGSDKSKWPSPSEDSDGDGVSNLDEFLAGTNPMDKESVLKMSLRATEQGVRLEWNTVSGLVYQVQSTEDGKNWSNLGAVRRATGAKDSMALDPGQKRFFRVLRVGGSSY